MGAFLSLIWESISAENSCSACFGTSKRAVNPGMFLRCQRVGQVEVLCTQITDCENMMQAKLNADPICIQNTCIQKIIPCEMGLKFMVWKAIMYFSSNYIFTYFPYFLPKENFVKITGFDIGTITFDSFSIVLYSSDPAWASRTGLLMTSLFYFF